MSFGTPFSIGSGASGSGTTVTFTVTNAVAAGLAVIVGASSNGTPGDSVTSVTDSKGNSYALVPGASITSGVASWCYAALNIATPLTTSDTITVTWGGSTVTHEAGAIACSGVGTAVASTVDLVSTLSGTSTAPYGVTSTYPGWSTELAVAVSASGNAGGSPSWAAGWTGLVTASLAGAQYTSIAAQVTTTAASLAAQASLSSSAPWSVLLVTLKPAAYAIGSVANPSGTSSAVITVTANTSAGDALAVAASASSNNVVASVTDTQGNTWTRGPQVNVAPSGYTWFCTNARALTLTGNGGNPDQITVSFGTGTNAHSAIAVCVPAGTGTDISVSANSTTASGQPSVTSPAPKRSTEFLVAAAVNANAGGVISWAAGWVSLGSAHQGTGQYTAVAYESSQSSYAAVTASGTISGSTTPWSLLLLSFTASLPPPPAVPPAQRPVRAAVPPEEPRGRVRGSAGAPVSFSLPPLPSRQRPVRAAVPPEEPRGRVRGSRGAPVTIVTPPVVTSAGRASPARSREVPEPRGRGRGSAGAPVTPPGVVSVVNAWTAYRQIGTGFAIDAPAIGTLDCPVASAAGTWLVAFCSVTLTSGFLGTSLGVADNQHGFWEPLGAPAGSSDEAGFTRCSIWIRRGGSAQNPAPATRHVYVYPAGLPDPVYPAVIAVTVIEVTGMSPYAPAASVTVATASANGATTISADAGSPGTQALTLAVAASDAAAFATGPGAPWTSLPGVAVTSPSPATLWTSPAWQVTAADAGAGWAIPQLPFQPPVLSDLSAVVATILISSPAPPYPKVNWPYVQLQAGFGSGALTPPDEITWTDISTRWLAGKGKTSIKAGQQYELAQPEAGEISLTLWNGDGALTPANTASPFWPQVAADVPLRLLMTWQGRTYCQFSGPVERWPSSWDPATLVGMAAVTVSDNWSLLMAQLGAVQKQQALACQPYALWSCDDAAGSASAQNAAPGNTRALAVAESKGGRGAGTYAFGTPAGINPGDPGGAAWTQSGLTAANQGYGFCLTCTDAGYPPLSAGMTVMGWFAPAALTSFAFTASHASPAVFTAAGNTFAAGTPVGLAGGSLPGGFNASTPYYVVNPSGATFGLDTSPSGGGLASTTTGSGTVYAGQVVANTYLLAGTNSVAGGAFAVFLGNRGGYIQGALYMRVFDRVSGASADTLVDSGRNYFALGQQFHVTLEITSTTWQVIVNGGAITPNGTAAGTCNLPASLQWLSFLGSADRFYTGSMLNGSANTLAVYPGLLPAGAVAQVVIAGYPGAAAGSPPVPPAQFAGEAAGSRIERLMGYGGYSGPRAISQQSVTQMAGITDIQGAQQVLTASGAQITGIQGQPAAQAVTYITGSDGGAIFTDGNGVICYLSRGDLYGQAPAFLLGELSSAGEYPYQPGAVLGYDKSLLYNIAQLTQATSAAGVPVVAANVPSVAAHGPFTFNSTVYLYDVSQVIDEAEWIVNTRGSAGERAESITVDAGKTAGWQLVLGIQPFTVVQVARRPQAGGSPVIIQCIVTQVIKTFDFAAGEASAQIVCDIFPQASVLTADSVTLGVLAGQAVLPW